MDEGILDDVSCLAPEGCGDSGASVAGGKTWGSAGGFDGLLTTKTGAEEMSCGADPGTSSGNVLGLSGSAICSQAGRTRGFPGGGGERLLPGGSSSEPWTVCSVDEESPTVPGESQKLVRAPWTHLYACLPSHITRSEETC